MRHGKVEALISDVKYKGGPDGGDTFEKPINLNNYSGWSNNPQLTVLRIITCMRYGKIIFKKSLMSSSLEEY